MAAGWRLLMSDTNPTQIHATSEATGFVLAPGDKGRPITVIGTNAFSSNGALTT
jgi:hypothetical protein